MTASIQPTRDPISELQISCEERLQEACIAYEEADVACREIRGETEKLKRQKEQAWRLIADMKTTINILKQGFQPTRYSYLPAKREAKKMHPVMTTIKNALAYAKFQDDDVKEATMDLIDKVGIDLDAAEYDSPDDVDEAVKSLESALNCTDKSDEDLDAAIKGSQDDIDEEEDPR